MIAANTSYKQNGVPVSILSGSYGIAHLTVHQYEYPKGHPCHNCPYMGLYESEENVENGTEHILPFTDYGSDAESACDLEDEEDLEI